MLAPSPRAPRAAALALAACGADDAELDPVPELGAGDHSPGDAPSAARTFTKRIDGYALHFFEQVTALAFGGDATTIGVPGTFASCGDSRNTYNGQAPPNGLGSHLDRLHNTPSCMGIAHEADNRYWVFGGLHGSIDRYDFVTDDGIGNDNHGDGLSWRYLHGEVARAPDVPSHLIHDGDSDSLYIADSGNGRIVRLDTGLPARSLGGLALGPDGKLYLVDLLGDQVLRIDS